MATSSIIAKIGLNSAGFKTGLAKCRAMVTQFKTSTSGIFSGIRDQMLGMFGVSLGVVGMAALTKQTIDLGGHVEDMARDLRMGKSEFQAIAYAAKLAGMEESRLVMTMNNLNLRTVEACDGNQNYRDAFERLGISLKKFASLSPDKKLEMLGRAFKKSGESLTALSDISQILGQKTGPQMLEVLDKISTDGMEKLTQSAIEAGHVMDEATLSALANAGDEIDKWQNKIIIAFGTFLGDMESEIARTKWTLILGKKLAQMGELIEDGVRDSCNYAISMLGALNHYMESFKLKMPKIIPSFFDTDFGKAFAKKFPKLTIGLSITNSMLGKTMKNEKVDDSEKSFSEIFGEELNKAKSKNNKRERSDLWSSKSVDWYDKEIAKAEKLRKAEKKRYVEAEKARKAKYDKSDKNIKIDDTKERQKALKQARGYNDSSMAKIGGGGLTAARYDVAEKQLSETKRQSELLKKIAENTENKNTKSELLMK